MILNPHKISSLIGAAILVHYLEKPRGHHGEWSAPGGPKAKPRGAAGPKGFGRGVGPTEALPSP